VIGFAGGEIPSVPLNHVLIKNYSVIGLHWGLYREKDPGLIGKCHDELTALAAAGMLRPLVGERIGLADVAAGLERLADGVTVGRVVCLP
jgi:NADPH2:quinone reductase